MKPASHHTPHEIDLRGVAALAEPVRRRLYQAVAGSPDALSREHAAKAAHVAVHTAKFHLDKLVQEGLLEVEYRRLTGRTGPGSGRPSKLYRRSDREITVSLPARQYDLLSRILANAVARSTATGEPVRAAAEAIAHEEGRLLGSAQPAVGEDELAAVANALTATGYEPRRCESGAVELNNCPFHRTAAEQTELVCGLNLDFVRGVCEGLEATTARPTLSPQPGKCCVRISTSPPNTDA